MKVIAFLVYGIFLSEIAWGQCDYSVTDVSTSNFGVYGIDPGDGGARFNVFLPDVDYGRETFKKMERDHQELLKELEYRKKVLELEKQRSALEVSEQQMALSLEGAKLFASDGTYLGVITSNQFVRDSIFNEFGKYGNEFSSTSIWNEFCDYGSEFNSKSVFNDCAQESPRIVKNGDVIGYLTVNIAKSRGVHPKILLHLLDDEEGENYRARIMKFME